MQARTRREHDLDARSRARGQGGRRHRGGRGHRPCGRARVLGGRCARLRSRPEGGRAGGADADPRSRAAPVGGRRPARPVGARAAASPRCGGLRRPGRARQRRRRAHPAERSRRGHGGGLGLPARRQPEGVVLPQPRRRPDHAGSGPRRPADQLHLARLVDRRLRRVGRLLGDQGRHRLDVSRARPYVRKGRDHRQLRLARRRRHPDAARRAHRRAASEPHRPDPARLHGRPRRTSRARSCSSPRITRATSPARRSTSAAAG